MQHMHGGRQAGGLLRLLRWQWWRLQRLLVLLLWLQRLLGCSM